MNISALVCFVNDLQIPFRKNTWVYTHQNLQSPFFKPNPHIHGLRTIEAGNHGFAFSFSQRD
jgi:hypothetical protein